MGRSKKGTVSQAKKRCWNEFSRFIRLRDCIKTTGDPGYGVCVTCGKRYEFKKLQAGHFLPGRRNAGLFDERGCHAQCFVCNVRLGGNWPEYLDYMTAEYGVDVVEELKALRHQVVTFDVQTLDEMRREYKRRADELIEGAGGEADGNADGEADGA